MTKSLRRSSRGRSARYKVGDYVEIIRHDGAFIGQLIGHTEDSTPSNSIWIVALADGRRKKEILPEKSLGKIVQDDEVEPARPRGGSARTTRITAALAKAKIGNSTSNCDSDERLAASDQNGEASHTAVKRVRSTAKTEIAKRKGRPLVGKATKRGKVASSENSNKNSKLTGPAVNVSTRSTRRSNPNEKLLVRKTKSKPSRRRGKRGWSRPSKDENVTKVKMLTGTLYLYRGENPRAEFVRFV